MLNSPLGAHMPPSGLWDRLLNLPCKHPASQGGWPTLTLLFAGFKPSPAQGVTASQALIGDGAAIRVGFLFLPPLLLASPTHQQSRFAAFLLSRATQGRATSPGGPSPLRVGCTAPGCTAPELHATTRDVTAPIPDLALSP